MYNMTMADVTISCTTLDKDVRVMYTVDGLAGFSVACALFIAMASVVVYESVTVPMSMYVWSFYGLWSICHLCRELNGEKGSLFITFNIQARM